LCCWVDLRGRASRPSRGRGARRGRVAAHVQLDDVRGLIVQGLVDPLDVAQPGQAGQWVAAVEAACGLARAFAGHGIDVAIDDVMSPPDVERHWRPLLAGLPADLVVIRPRRQVVLERGRRRLKTVPEGLVVQQYEESALWDSDRVLDSSDLSVAESVEALTGLLARGGLTL
jgi:hypothetical protein